MCISYAEQSAFLGCLQLSVDTNTHPEGDTPYLPMLVNPHRILANSQS